MWLKSIKTACILFAGSTFALAQSSINAPKYSNEFLNIGIGARALGMGNTQVAVTNDVYAGYWNPAGLTSLSNKYEVAYMHAEYFAGIAKFDYASVATKLDTSSTLALSYIRFGIDNIPDTRFLYDASGTINYNNIRFFSATDNAFLLSYARKNLGISGLNVGANFKVIYRNVGSFANAWGIGVDASAKYKYKKWYLGAMIRDVTNTWNMWSVNSELLKDVYTATNNTIPTNSIELTLPRLILGFAREFRFKEKYGVLASADFDFTFDGKRNTVISTKAFSTDPKIGLEIDYSKKIFVRAGIANIQQLKKDYTTDKYWSISPNFGVGVKINRFSLDYALTTLAGISQSGLYSNIVSLKVGI